MMPGSGIAELKKVCPEFDLKGNKNYVIVTETTIVENERSPVHHSSLRKVMIERIEQDDPGVFLRISCFDKHIKLGGYLKKSEELLLVTSGIYDHLLVEADHRGRLVDIHNVPEIREEFEDIRESLSIVYDGIEFHDYMDGLARKLKDPDKVLEELKQHNFFGLFFNGLYRKHLEYQVVTEKCPFYGIYGRITVDGLYKLVADESKPDKTLISFKTKDMEGLGYTLKSEGFYILDELTDWLCEAEIHVEEKGENIVRSTFFNIKEI